MALAADRPLEHLHCHIGRQRQSKTEKANAEEPFDLWPQVRPYLLALGQTALRLSNRRPRPATGPYTGWWRAG